MGGHQCSVARYDTLDVSPFTQKSKVIVRTPPCPLSLPFNSSVICHGVCSSLLGPRPACITPLPKLRGWRMFWCPGGRLGLDRSFAAFLPKSTVLISAGPYLSMAPKRARAKKSTAAIAPADESSQMPPLTPGLASEFMAAMGQTLLKEFYETRDRANDCDDTQHREPQQVHTCCPRPCPVVRRRVFGPPNYNSDTFWLWLVGRATCGP